MLYFDSQPTVEQFYEKNGCRKSLQSYIINKKGKSQLEHNLPKGVENYENARKN